MAYWNEKLHKKSYLLEFSHGDEITSYIFSLPPQSEDFVFPQRVAETKTFGGSVFEDYGNDVVNITLSGTTANNRLRLITKDGVRYEMTGEEAIFDLQKTIEKYGKIDKLDNKTVKLFSQDAKDCKNWQIEIKEFVIKRSKDNPLAYTYSLSAVGIPETNVISHNLAKKESSIDTLRNTVEKSCNWIEKGVQCLKDGLSMYNKGLDYIEQLDESVNKVRESLLVYVNLASRYIDTTTQYIAETFGLGENIINSVARVTLGSGLTLFNDIAQMNQVANDIYKYCLRFPEENIYIQLIEKYKMTARDIKSRWVEIASETEFKTAQSKAIMKNYSNIIGLCVIPGSDDEDDQVIVNYGYKQKVVSSTDTWDSLANTYYQNTNLGSLIALYNGLDNNKDKLVAGNTIRIPIISKIDSNRTDNLIFTDPDNTDNYGTDILINNGDFEIKNNDIKLISGTKNLAQAINSRLQTGLGARIHLTSYGIKASIGDASMIQNYIISSVRQTMLADPRVKSVDRISFKGKGDAIYIEVIYTDINNVEQNYGGTI